MDINRSIIELVCEEFKDKMNGNETYNDFISSFKKEQIEKIYKLDAAINDNTEELAHIWSLSIHPKKIIVEDFKNNIKEIYSNILMNAPEDFIKQLEIYLKIYKDKVLIMDIFNLKLSLHFIEFLHNYNLAKVKYLKSENKLYIYTPLELRNVLKEILKNKEIKLKSKETSKYERNLHNLIATYGIISIKNLTKIYSKIYEKTNQKDLINRIIVNHAFDSEIDLVNTDEGYIVYGLAFSNEDDALEFYYSLPDNIDYKIYTKEEYEEIGEGTYHQQFEEFGKLYVVLENIFNMNEEEIDEFDDAFILDYIFSYQIDSETAKRNLSINLNKVFGIMNLRDKAFISNTILSLAKKYPNFNYKGYSFNDYNKMNK